MTKTASNLSEGANEGKEVSIGNLANPSTGSTQTFLVECLIFGEDFFPRTFTIRAITCGLKL